MDPSWLDVAVEQARAGLASGGIPIGAALVGPDGEVLGRGHNRRVQDGDPTVHGETAAFRDAGRRRDYRSTTMVTTLSPCWYCSGLIRQFGIGAVLVGRPGPSTAATTGWPSTGCACRCSTTRVAWT